MCFKLFLYVWRLSTGVSTESAIKTENHKRGKFSNLEVVYLLAGLHFLLFFPLLLQLHRDSEEMHVDSEKMHVDSEKMHADSEKMHADSEEKHGQ